MLLNFRHKRFLARKLPVLALITLVWLFALIGIVRAIKLPPDTSAAFIQTSGPNASLGVGDFYTNVEGDNDTHFLRVNVPCTWPGDQPITFALFDPEIQEPDPDRTIEPPFADDEIRDDTNTTVHMPPDTNIQFADVTTFTLYALNNQGQIDHTVVGPVAFTPSLTNSTNGLWVEMVTFTPNTPNFGCGLYGLSAETANNDDNAWKLSVSYDPDCTVSLPGNPGTCAGVGQAQSTALNNGNEQDDADGIPGTGDDLLISAVKLSYQHENANSNTLTCQIFYHLVYPDDRPVVTFHNFDLDTNNSTGSTSTVTHTSPTGRVIVGAGSANRSWNNAPTPPQIPPVRGGDVIQVAPDEVGLWQTEVCVRRDNQYIFEGQRDEVVFLQAPPAPNLVVSKDDGRTIVGQNDTLNYTIGFSNIADTTPLVPAVPGAAEQVTLTDTLPPNTTFVNCQVNSPFTGSCVENPTGIVTARINELVVAGASGSVNLTVQVNANAPTGFLTNTVRLDYVGSIIALQYPPKTATDIDEVQPQAATATPTDTPPPTATATATPTTPAPAPTSDSTNTPEPTATTPPGSTPTTPPGSTPTPTSPSSSPSRGDQGATNPTPVPPPPAAPGIASIPAPEPTPTGVLYLPETGYRPVTPQDRSTQHLFIGFGVLLGVALGGLLFWRIRRHQA